MYYIYEIKNLTTENSYIGQSNNPNRRFREHKSAFQNILNPSYDYPLYRAIRKYGLKNFSFNVIAEADTIEEVNELEIKLISERGYYNIADGGSIRTDMQILNEVEAEKVREAIKKKEPYQSISQRFDISICLVSNINHGNRYFKPTESYPLMDNSIKTVEEYSELILLLTNSFLSFSEIAKQTGLAKSTVKKINYGKLRRDVWDGDFPIRKEHKSDRIIELLLTTNLSIEEISSETYSSRQTVVRINKGLTHKKEHLIYPLRNL